jgi:hypothetical protein
MAARILIFLVFCAHYLFVPFFQGIGSHTSLSICHSTIRALGTDNGIFDDVVKGV